MSGAPHRAWRESALRDLRAARALEREAAASELPFEVRPSWPGLDWVVFNESLHEFAARVKRVAHRLGEPDSVKAEHWLPAYDDSPPDLIARWSVRGVAWTVRALGPTGCKIDPRTKYLPEQAPAIHPECAAVLAALGDIPGEP